MRYVFNKKEIFTVLANHLAHEKKLIPTSPITWYVEPKAVTVIAEWDDEAKDVSACRNNDTLARYERECGCYVEYNLATLRITSIVQCPLHNQHIRGLLKERNGQDK